MTGTYEHSIDAKGRLFIPSKLQEELGACFYLAIGTGDFLTIYPESAWNTLSERVAALSSDEAEEMEVFFANASKCVPDNQNRIIVPQKLRGYAGLTKDVVVVGANNVAKIWSAERWAEKEQRELSPQNLKNIMSRFRL